MSTAPIRLHRPGELSLAALPPLSLYVHLPWCIKKCPYCDFNSHEKKGDLPEDAYCAALVADLEHALPWIWGRRVHSLFFGVFIFNQCKFFCLMADSTIESIYHVLFLRDCLYCCCK